MLAVLTSYIVACGLSFWAYTLTVQARAVFGPRFVEMNPAIPFFSVLPLPLPVILLGIITMVYVLFFAIFRAARKEWLMILPVVMIPSFLVVDPLNDFFLLFYGISLLPYVPIAVFDSMALGVWAALSCMPEELRQEGPGQ